LRDFYNQQYHGVLDWRLGLDLAKIANNPNGSIDFSSIYWKYYVHDLAYTFAEPKEAENGAFTIKNRGKTILITHPFWSKSYINELRENIEFDVDINIIEMAKIVRE
jgi:DEAD/DEAH box helicase domain-containing protein